MIRFPNRTAQSAIYTSGSPSYVDVSAGAELTGMKTFATVAAAESWQTGDELFVLVKQSDSNWQVWRATWDAVNAFIKVGEIEDSRGSLTSGSPADVSATVSKAALGKFQTLEMLHAAALY